MKIFDVAKKLNIKSTQYDNYFDKFLKLNLIKNNKKSNLIVVTSINPTPVGEGKTTLLIGLVDAMNYHGYSCIGTLRQPSLGPVFGMKGTATGGGKSTLLDDNYINLHFTGDFHALTVANNLISTIIENEIFFNSKLNIDPKKILWKRCIDLNDRGLRNLEIKIKNDLFYNTSFDITAASDLMALFCLCNDIYDFKNKIDNTIVAYTKKNKPIKISELNISDAIIEILKQSFKPNLAQTKYHNPIIIHGGPFANIAHGCNSIIATNTAMNYADYVITECGFGSDLGFEKMMNIKMQTMNKMPNLVIICATIKALKYHGNNKNDILALKEGFKNLYHHINNVRKYDLEPLVILNKNKIDSKQEVDEFINYCKQNNINYAISSIYNDGPSKNTKIIVDKIIKSVKTKPHKKYLYDVNNDNLNTKLNKILECSYSANTIVISDKVKKILKDKNIQDYFICIAKTQYSLSSNPNDLNVPQNIKIEIKDYSINHAAKMIILLCDNIYRMPGLNKDPRAKNFKW